MFAFFAFNMLALFGVFTLAKFLMRRKNNHELRNQNLQALSMIIDYTSMRNGHCSASDKQKFMAKFNEDAEKLTAKFKGQFDEVSGENITSLIDYRASNKAKCGTGNQ